MMQPQEEVSPHDPRLGWEGAVSVQHAAEWAMPWRVPFDQLDLFPEPLNLRAAMPAGVRLTFRSDTTALAGAIEPHAELGALDLCVDGRLVATQPLQDVAQFSFQGLPGGEKLIELWLPPSGELRLRGLALDPGATLAAAEDRPCRLGTGRRPRWVTYGSSITHCRGAASPTQTWPAIVARERGLHLTCLGYGSHCQLDIAVARMMRDLPADFLSMKVGINIYGLNSLNERTFRPAVIGFIQTVRDGHPDTPFAVLSPILSRPREETPNQAGMTLRLMREEIAAAVAALQAHGDRRLSYVDGLEIMGPEQADLIPGDTHPSADGYRVMAGRFIRRVVEEQWRWPRQAAA